MEPLQDKLVVQPASDSSDEEPRVIQAFAPSKGVWVVSTSRGVSTLHIVGSCYRIPGTRYGHWKEVPETVPMTSYKKACRGCFPRGHPIIQKPEKVPMTEDLSEGMPPALATEEASDSSDSSSD